ncbi:hypothetical protein LWI28_010145 [Acer negundo]|uniref:Uncharacterized protein n=1 Tax=Acer negundo TaxID=4023 RepID=A0AAD5IPN8_ACENE|nr:hypothetical protein LWI28_010145 [Acer negundo]
MVRKVNVLRVEDSPSSSESSKWSSKGESTRSAFKARGSPKGDELEVRVNKLKEARIGQIAVEFLIPKLVGIRMPGEMASNSDGVSMAFHPAFLEIGARLPLQPYIRRVLRELMITLAQLNLDGWRVVIGMYALWCGLGFLAPTLREIAH